MTQVAISSAGVDFGAHSVFSDITFTIAARERWGVVGRNGTGKTTLFKLITGQLQPTRGTVTRQPGIRVALLEQHRDFEGASTVWEAAAGQFRDLLALERSLAEQAGALGENSTEAELERYGRDLERFEREGGYTFAPRVDAVLDGLGFEPEGARTRPLSHLSGGERGRLGLARQLVSPADVLLLDEPTNHLDLETTRWLEQYLQETDRSVVLVSHDRAFLDAVADHILHFEGDSATAYSGGYAAFVTQREEQRLAQQRAFDKQRKTIASQEDYIRRNLAGQNTRQAKGRRKLLSRLPRLNAPIGSDGTMGLRFDVKERGGDQVLVAERARIVVGDRTLIDGLSARVMRQDVVGFVGPNGAGKSTLLRAVMGETELAVGELRIGGSISVAYYRQDMAQIPMNQTLYQIVNDLRPLWERNMIQGHLGRFGFSGDEVLRRADTLSGGERARVALAMLVLSRANFLILDEPTNHLDVESIEALEEALESYEGTVILVSHDRALLRALTTRVWVLHDRHVTDFDGSFAEWETASAERAHAAAVKASEAVALRRVHEKQHTQRKAGTKDDSRAAAREVRRAAADAERRVESAEREVSELAGALEDPDLYTRADGVQRARKLGVTLDTARKRLDAAIVEWERATEAVEKLAAP